MPKDTKSLGNNKAPACESRGFVRKRKKGCILTHLLPVMQEYGDGTRQAVTLPSLYALNEDGLYNLLIREDCLVVYSGEETDFGIGASKMQNGTFLLKAVAGNLYQHPTTGVGLIDFLHSNMENNGLAAKLQAEFGADKVVIKNAYIDSATGELLLETEEKEDNHG
jgi:hypothetical protein